VLHKCHYASIPGAGSLPGGKSPSAPQPAQHLRHRVVGGRKTSLQAKARVNPTKPAVPGIPARREFEFERNGTVVLFAGLNVHEDDVAGWVTDSTCSDNFVTFLWDLIDQTPDGMDLHCIVDNLSAHGTDQVAELLEHNPRVHLHFTPTHASWLNQVWAVLLHTRASSTATRRVLLC
jgi:hypothetical protein